VPRSGYCFDLLGGWVSFATPPPDGSDVGFFGTISTNPDLAVTNWDQAHGNHLFLNTSPVGAAAHATSPVLTRLSAQPNPFRTSTVVRVPAAAHRPTRLDVYDAAGRLILQSAISNLQSAIALDLRSMPPGVYVCRTSTGAELKLIRTAW
jgi:hypothetical protein